MNVVNLTSQIEKFHDDCAAERSLALLVIGYE